jgi:hypothetical protein
MTKNTAIAWTSGIAVALAGMTFAHAEVAQSGWSLSVLGQYTDADDRGPNTDSGLGARVGLSYALSNMLVLDGIIGYQEFEGDTSADLWQDEYTVGLDLQWHVLPDLGPLHPYLVAGFGGVRTTDITSPFRTTNDYFWDAGLGVQVPFGNSAFGLIADVKHRSIYWDDTRGQQDPNEVIAGIGLTYDLSPAPKMIVMRDAADGDADGDGVPDSLDRCPGTAAGTAVDAYGCAVATVGDADGDGIPDNMDRCPNTPAGTPVDGEGCPAPETVVIYFAFDSAALNGAARKALDVVANNLNQRSYVVAIANGHADRTGTEAYNQALSQRRANAVADYLGSQGVSKNQLRTRAFGETRPVNAGETPEQRARNRRVEINLVEER